jgi:hypothetical protein
MIAVNEAFSATYAQARVQVPRGSGHEPAWPLNPTCTRWGREGETLAMDVARDGPADAASVLIVSSACHGVEGHCGTGVQVFALHDQEWRRQGARRRAWRWSTSTHSTRMASRTWTPRHA